MSVVGQARFVAKSRSGVTHNALISLNLMKSPNFNAAVSPV